MKKKKKFIFPPLVSFHSDRKFGIEIYKWLFTTASFIGQNNLKYADEILSHSKLGVNVNGCVRHIADRVYCLILVYPIWTTRMAWNDTLKLLSICSPTFSSLDGTKSSPIKEVQLSQASLEIYQWAESHHGCYKLLEILCADKYSKISVIYKKKCYLLKFSNLTF